MPRECEPRRLAAALLPAVLVLAGCSGNGEVSGKVTYQGRPVPWGRITFLSDVGDHVVKSTAITDGRYTLADFPAGPAVISVETFPPAPAPGAAPPRTGPVTAGATGIRPPENGNPFAAPSGDKYVWVPPQFANPDKSGLKYVVSAGKQDHPVDLGP